MDYNKVNKIVAEMLKRKSKYRASSVVKGYGEFSPGYEISRPKVNRKEIVISWNSYTFAKKDTREKNVKEFKEKIIPALKENGIEFTEENNNIVIKKK